MDEFFNVCKALGIRPENALEHKRAIDGYIEQVAARALDMQTGTFTAEDHRRTFNRLVAEDAAAKDFAQ